jgi:hypothetical protein
MTHWESKVGQPKVERSKLAQQAKAGFCISWSDAVELCGPLRGSLSSRCDPERTQLLDQFAAWINEGGAGREPNR